MLNDQTQVTGYWWKTLQKAAEDPDCSSAERYKKLENTWKLSA